MTPNLEDFTSWLNNSGLKLSTARTLSSWIRKCLLMIDIKKDQLIPNDFILKFEENLDPKYRGAFRTAWRYFVRFSEDCLFATLKAPAVDFPDQRTGKGRPRPPPLPIEDIIRHVLKTGIPVPRISRLKWADLQGGEGGADLKDVHTSQIYKVPVEMVKRLKEWGQPINKDSPLIPDQPGSLEPMSPYKLRFYETDQLLR